MATVSSHIALRVRCSAFRVRRYARPRVVGIFCRHLRICRVYRDACLQGLAIGGAIAISTRSSVSYAPTSAIPNPFPIGDYPLRESDGAAIAPHSADLQYNDTSLRESPDNGSNAFLQANRLQKNADRSASFGPAR